MPRKAKELYGKAKGMWKEYQKKNIDLEVYGDRELINALRPTNSLKR